ncbi:hypothetical protein CGL52_02545 [Pyrobaculum aerophilum]|uniref:Uncharacterized protein n=1 Tax=Pyrobaculum aerophilum TaxID=13773 RepID=A0A371R6D4_9CREN|nr:hypothetical protein CGL52_02545 [Pyrobaculum aerophilum]
MESMQRLVISLILISIAIALMAYILTNLHAEYEYFSFAKPVIAYADSHHVKLCIYNRPACTPRK